MRPAELPRGFELKYNEKRSRSGTGSSQRERRRAASQPEDKRSFLEGLSVAAQRHQVGCHRHTLHRGPNREPSLRRDLLVGLADAHGSHFHSHPNDGPSGRRAIATPMALNTRVCWNCRKCSITFSTPWSIVGTGIPDSHAGADEGAHSQHLSGLAHSELDLRNALGFTKDHHPVPTNTP